MAVLSVFSASFKAVRFAKLKMSAVSLANERVEIIHNMPYDSLATEHGTIYPPGDILDSEVVELNEQKLSIETSIKYVDDDYDGNALGTIVGKPVDIYPYDYKQASVKIYKYGTSTLLANLSTDIAAKASETPGNSGIIYLCVIDSANQPVPQAQVIISNSTLSPVLSINTTTDDSGCIMVPALPPDEHNNYHIEVTKDGYSTDMTYPRTPQNPNEIQPNINVIAQQVSRVTLSIDKKSTFKLKAQDLNGLPVPNLSLRIHGAKEIYFNPSTYKYDQNVNCDANGETILLDMEWDNYTISVLTPGFYVSSTTPTIPLYLAPDSILEGIIYITNSASAPQITSITPLKAVVGDLTSISVSGANFDNTATIQIINSTTGTIINGVDVTVSAHKTITADFQLPVDSVGLWNIKVINVNAEYAEQKNGIEIVSGS